jgi:hypothetical protein
MKILKLLICTLFLTSFQVISFSQDQPCGTPAGKTPWLEYYQTHKHEFPIKRPDNPASVWVPVSIVNVGDDNGSGYYRTIDLLYTLDKVNKDFEQVGMKFYLSEPIRYVNNSKYNRHTFQTVGPMIQAFRRNGALTSFFVADPAGNCGYAWQDVVVIGKNCSGPLSSTWTHENGHHFSLPHTFSGWEGTDYNDNINVSTQVNNAERVSRVNCASLGDGFCDTPPDYISDRWSCNSSQMSPQEFKDPSGQKFRVDGTYFMSYSNDGCTDKFSQEQMDAMNSNLRTEHASYLNKEKVESDITENTNLIFPIDSTVVDPTEVTLRWNKPTGAIYYFLELSAVSNFQALVQRVELRDTFFVARNLLPGRRYVWRVFAYNNYDFNNPISTTEQFLTSRPATSSSEPQELSELIISPNPINSGEELQIELTMDNSKK